MPLVTCPDCALQISDAAPACPKCGRPIATQPTPPTAALRKVVSSLGIGGLVQLAGAALFLPALLVIGIAFLAGGSALGVAASLSLALCGPALVIGILLWAWGRRLCTRWLCGACGIQLSGGEVRLCPSCRSPLEYDAR